MAILHVVYDTQNQTYDLMNENGECEFYSGDAYEFIYHLEEIGAEEVRPLEYRIN